MKGECPVQNDERHLVPGGIYIVVKIAEYTNGQYMDVQGPGIRGDNIVVSGIGVSSFANPNQITTMTNLIEKARLLVKGEPEKSLIRKGVTNVDDTLTAEGQALFNDFQYRANKAAFVADAAIAAILAETEEN